MEQPAKYIPEQEKVLFDTIDQSLENYYKLVRRWLDLNELQKSLLDVCYRVVDIHCRLRETLEEIASLDTLGHIYELLEFEIITFDKTRDYDPSLLYAFHRMVYDTLQDRLDTMLHLLPKESPHNQIKSITNETTYIKIHNS